MVLLLAAVLTIGSVNAMDAGTTDDAISVEQNDNIAVEDNDAQVASVENGDDIVSADNSLVAELAVADDGSNILSDSENSGQSTSNSSSQQSQPAKTKTQTKMFFFGQIKIPIKYKKYLLKDYKPSKKNKKTWKEYKAYKKIYNKQMKLFRKYLKKLIPKLQKKGLDNQGKICEQGMAIH